MRIKFLSNNIINKIAAGEVVERPAAVVKELVENSLDSGATLVEVYIDNAGRNLIMVRDNGMGIKQEDLEICAQRYATSKLDEEDITNIQYFGFRGEALAAIASVSKFEIKSKYYDDQYAYEMTIIDSIQSRITPSNIKIGTEIMVRDLFYTTPARLKFLKSERVEYEAINDLLKKIAITNLAEFKFISNDKQIFHYTKANNKHQRIIDILGKDFGENSLEVDFSDDNIKLTGLISLPTFNSRNNRGQYLSINNRVIKEKLILQAIKFAYIDYIPDGSYPIFALNLEIDGKEVDVNVHPTKAEVRFMRESYIQNFIKLAIKKTLEAGAKKASSHISNYIINENISDSIKSKLEEKQQETFNPIPNQIDLIQEFNEASFNDFNKLNNKYTEPRSHYNKELQTNKLENVSLFQNNAELKMPQAKAQIGACYIVAEADDGLMVYDQHAIAERILYEEMKEDIIKKNKNFAQLLLIPFSIEITAEVAERFAMNKEVFNQVGLNFDLDSYNLIKITSIPLSLVEKDTEKLINIIIEEFQEYGINMELEKIMNLILKTKACYNSVRSGKILSLSEMNELIRKAELLKNTGQCNHGRPTYIKLSFNQLDILFERI